jgi:hypothetical protein
MRYLFAAAAIVAAILLCVESAAAADMPQPPPEPAAPIIANDWKFQATFYGWATAIDGKVGVRGLPPASVDVKFSDILKNLDGGVMGSFYATNGKWMVLTDLIAAKLSDRVNVGPFGGSVKFEQTQVIASGIVGYALPLDIQNLQLSATAGVRYNYLRANFEINPALFPRTFSREGTKSWADPIVGLSAHYDINDRWFVNALADVGGFGVGSKLTAQGFLAVGYQWTKTISTSIGYRAIYTDYKSGGFVYKTTQHGVFSSISFNF